MWWNWIVMKLEDALSLIRDIPDYPKPGILFKDITPLLANPSAYSNVIKAFAAKIGKTLFGKAPAVETAALIMPFDPKSASSGGGSTDVADVSWTTPTVGMNAATEPSGG